MLRRIPPKNIKNPRPDQGRFGDCYERGSAERQEKKQEKTKPSQKHEYRNHKDCRGRRQWAGGNRSLRIAPRRKERSAFSWFEKFTVEWSETFLSNNEKHVQRKGEHR